MHMCDLFITLTIAKEQQPFTYHEVQQAYCLKISFCPEAENLHRIPACIYGWQLLWRQYC